MSAPIQPMTVQPSSTLMSTIGAIWGCLPTIPMMIGKPQSPSKANPPMKVHTSSTPTASESDDQCQYGSQSDQPLASLLLDGFFFHVGLHSLDLESDLSARDGYLITSSRFAVS